MPVYASTQGFAAHRRHPRALVLIVGGHAVLIAAVMTAKMDIAPKLDPTRTVIDFIDPVKPPPPPEPVPPKPEQQVQPRNSQVDLPKTVIPVPVPDDAALTKVNLPSLPLPGPIGPGIQPILDPAPKQDPVRVAPRFATPDHLLRPPYPDDKRRLEEEGSLRLRLSIDERGRVVAVEPLGAVDRSFFESARKHLIAKWRYKPATLDGRPIPSSTVITLRFELES